MYALKLEKQCVRNSWLLVFGDMKASHLSGIAVGHRTMASAFLSRLFQKMSPSWAWHRAWCQNKNEEEWS